MNWFYRESEVCYGPMSLETIKSLYEGGVISGDTLIKNEFDTDWRAYHIALSSQTKSSFTISFYITHISRVMSLITGLKNIDSHFLKAIFSEIFKTKSAQDADSIFNQGNLNIQTTLQDNTSNIPHPWIFFRLLFVSLVLTLAFAWAIQRFENILLYPGWLIVGAFAVPISTLFFFFELNLIKNISLYRVSLLFVVGGLISLIISLILYEMSSLAEWLGPIAAGPIEEIAKLLTVIIFAKRWGVFRWTLNGMVMGAAVGAGFASFETSGYIFSSMINDVGDWKTMLVRAVTAPFTHTIWTACIVGALWHCAALNDVSFKHIFKLTFARVFLAIVFIHMIWNSSFNLSIFGPGMGIIIKYLILGFLGWIVIFQLLQQGINQFKSNIHIK